MRLATAALISIVSCLSLTLPVQASEGQLLVFPPVSGRVTISAGTLAAQSVPSDTQGRSVAFGEAFRVWTVWYIDTSNCTSIATGSITASEGPKYGSVSTTMGSSPLPPGYPCAGVSLPETTAYYTWTKRTSVTIVDFFNLLYQATNGATASTDWQMELSGKGSGDCCNASNVGTVGVGDPVSVGTGNVFEQVTDYQTAGQNKLSFIRYYNGLGVPNTYAATLGTNWRSNFDRYVNILPNGLVIVERPDGQLLNFTQKGSAFLPDSDVDYVLVKSGSTWTMKDHDDTVETYTALNATEVLLDSIRLRNGYTQTLKYNASHQLESVTDSYGRELLFKYLSSGTLDTVTTPDGLVLTYGYNSIPGGIDNQLASVSYSTTPATSQQYEYTQSGLPFSLTGIIDEDGNTYSSFTYDQFGRGLTSQLGNGADLTTVSYDDSNGSRTVTNALSSTDTYSFAILQDAPKVTKIARAATATTAAATRLFTYDSNGYLASRTDWNGIKSTYVNDTHGDPTTINEAVGTPVARSTTIVYDPTFVHLPDTITTPDVTVTYKYDSEGNPLTETLTDTTSQTEPYKTNGEERTWTYTWKDSLLASLKNPRTDVAVLTTFTYDSTGALTTVTNALDQGIRITKHLPGGLPLTVVDPNNVTRTLTYDARQRLTSSTVDTAKGNLTTTYTFDPTGELKKLALPDNSFLAYTYDTAHRLTQVRDANGNNIQYSLDVLADITAINTYSSANVLSYQHSATFDPLGRTLTDVGGAGQTTTFTYDNNGNPLTVTDGLKHKSVQVFDALNRLTKVTDANKGITQFTYDPHDRPLTVEDPDTNITSYVYDGFGDVVQQLSPDSGTTVFYYNPDADLTKKVDALHVITDQTFDKLDRVLTTTYPADISENVTYTYDQNTSAFGFGIGRLTSVSDVAGALTRSYDERGNVLAETRVHSGKPYAITYTYDPAGRIASISYPDGAIVGNTYDAAGYFKQLSARPAGSATQQTLASIAHLPFGPLNSVTFGNGIAESWTFDLDYRPTTILDVLSSTKLQSLTYGYDLANNLKKITDAVNPANSQTLGYDVLNRITSAVSGTGGYGTLGWAYDANGNLTTTTVGNTTTKYATASGSNRLASYTNGTAATTVSTNANGNITGIPPVGSSTTATFAYNNANRLSSVTGASSAATYIYDFTGRRFSKTIAGAPILYFYGQDSALLEEDNSGSYTDYLYADGRPMADLQPDVTSKADQVNIILADRLGTPQFVVNSSAATVWSNTYQPYGKGGNPVSAIVNNLRLPGQHYDRETGFHYNMNRDYMPTFGRYLEADPIGLEGGLNPYRYGDANPAKFSDTLGLCATSDQSSSLPQTDDDDPGLVASSIVCFPFCEGATITQGGDDYIVIGLGIPGYSSSVQYATSMTGYAQGGSFNLSSDGLTVGLSVNGTPAFGRSFGPGQEVSFTVGIPIDTVLDQPAVRWFFRQIGLDY
jgi:RHS repeat-associated protein